MAKKIKITVVDDEIEYMNDMAKGLEILGYEVSKAASGSHAIEVITKERPDIVLCDYKLDDMDGTQIIEKTKPDNPRTVYIMITAYYDEKFADAFRKAGVARVIYKPVQLLELDDTIKKVLNERRDRAS